jgi:hypothetical protein
MRVELFVQAGLRRTPQVEVEDALELFRCGQRDQIATVFESTRLDDLVEDLGLESRHDVCEVRRVEEALQQSTPIAADRVGALGPVGIQGLWHGTGDDTVVRVQETVLNDVSS